MNGNTSNIAQSEVAVWRREHLGSHVCYTVRREGAQCCGALRTGGWLVSMCEHVHMHRCNMKICAGVVCVGACGFICLRVPEVHKCKGEKHAVLAQWRRLMPDAWALVKFLFPRWLSAGQRSQGRTGGPPGAVRRCGNITAGGLCDNWYL